jgi:D-glycero-D-manno-heptose 1,7-bisphosphate phosphatase
MNKAVFLDRDGTLIEEKEYLHRPEELVILPGVPEALKQLFDHHFLLFLITNQSGVGRGYFPIEAVHLVHQRLEEQLEKAGVRLAGIFIAPEAPDQPSQGRKPAPYFLLDASRRHQIALSESFIIGDKLIDLECGWNAGVKKSILVRTGYGAWTEKTHPAETACAWVANSLPEAADYILQLAG